MALKPENPVVGGTVLRRAAIQSPNYQAGVSGWTINQDGSAEFNNLTFRGTFAGNHFIINSAGIFFYSGTPAAGNLIMSVTPSTTGGTDTFGNHYVPLTGQYDNSGGFFTQTGAGFVTFGTGSLSGGWTANTSIQNDSSGDLTVSATAALLLNGATVQINGSSSTGFGSNGGVTSGPSGTVNSFPAAGPNHSHAEAHTHPL